ncbi:hypothetical protein EIN_404570 [Entamoeba invadens IP1]|uniref:UBR-type domain-containing protein n=1 Tax=Entamoeba invadens IP1 TaxID=370355 RepID=A0A0A1U6L7_ENTIV|nr:hypothetical protein EIN_404570 [Entamoeba invadens IP1]ELP90063.1 hypothetical protein EIN_404570 [Entamoeba invadens IP1]|eukprot:XP_004256834.1 hypothetical protein EIN_404570 [Entamoeba invadens IP1]
MNILRGINPQEFEKVFETQLNQVCQSRFSTTDMLLSNTFGFANVSMLVDAFAQSPKRRKCFGPIYTSYSCKRCYGDGICLCANCFDPSQHIGHSYTRSDTSCGYCDCGIFKNGCTNNCLTHNTFSCENPVVFEQFFKTDLAQAKAIVRCVLLAVQTFFDFVTDPLTQITNFTRVFKGLLLVLQNEVLYTLISSVSSEKINSTDPFIFHLAKALRKYSNNTEFIRTIGYNWFIPLASSTYNYKNYKCFVLPVYEKNESFYFKTLFTTNFDETSSGIITNLKNTNYALLDSFRFFFDADVMKLYYVDLSFTKSFQSTVNLFNNFCNKISNVRDTDMAVFERLICVILNGFLNYPQNCRYYKQNDMLQLVFKTFKLLSFCEVPFVASIVKMLSKSDEGNVIVENLKQHFFVEKNTQLLFRAFPSQNKNFTLKFPQSYDVPNFVNAMHYKMISHDTKFLEIEKSFDTKTAVFEYNNIFDNFGVFSFFESMKMRSDVISVLHDEMKDLSQEQMLTLIIWILHYNSEDIFSYLNQATVFNAIEKENKKLTVKELFFAFKLTKMANPFLPFSTQAVECLYVLLCTITQYPVGVYFAKTTAHPVLKSFLLTEIMEQCVDTQPLFVIHLLWLRVYHKVVLEKDKKGVLLFSKFREFLEKFPTFYKSLYQLSILYENVTYGSQEVFLGSTLHL